MRQRRIKTAKRGRARSGLAGRAVVVERATLARAHGSGSWLGVARCLRNSIAPPHEVELSLVPTRQTRWSTRSTSGSARSASRHRRNSYPVEAAAIHGSCGIHV